MRNEYTVNRELWFTAAEAWENLDKKRKRKRVIWFAVGVLALALGVFLIVSPLGSLPDVAIAFLAALFCAYMLYFRFRLTNTRKFESISEKYKAESWLRVIELNEEEIVASERDNTAHCDYEDIHEIREDGRFAWIVFENGSYALLCKNAFPEGDWESCAALLEEKRPKPEPAVPELPELPEADGKKSRFRRKKKEKEPDHL